MSALAAHQIATRFVMLALTGGLFILVPTGPASAREQVTQPTDTETLQQGAELFRTSCAPCHGATGAGTPGLFPPLRDNERVLDPAYVEEVVRQGLSGPIVVNGATYDLVMPPPAGLSDSDIQALVAFVSGGLELPPGSEQRTLPAAGTVAATLPITSVVAFGLAFLIAAAVAVVVFVPKVAAVTDRLTLPWFDAWLKTSVIVIYFVVGTVVVPSLILGLGVVASLPRLVRDLLGLGIWTVAIGLGLWGLWWAQRRNRV